MDERRKERLLLMGLTGECDDEEHRILSYDRSSKTTPATQEVETAAEVENWLPLLGKATEIYAAKLRQAYAKAVAHRSLSLTAIIDGQSQSFSSVEGKFNALVGESARLRKSGSSIDPFFNDAYGQIVAMGTPIIPFLLKEVQKQSGHWITALTWITGIDLVTPDMYGNLRLMREVWIQWGIKNGHLGDDMQGKVVREKSEEHSGKQLQFHK